MGKIYGVADLKYKSYFMDCLKPRLKLTFEYVQSWYSYRKSATPNYHSRLAKVN